MHSKSALRKARICLSRVFPLARLSIKRCVTLPGQSVLRVRRGVRAALLGVFVSVALIAPMAACQKVEGGATPDGSAIFAQRCSECHGNRGQGVAAAVTIAGPSLKAEHDLGKVMTAVESGPSHMPAFSRVLSGPEIRAVSRYVTTQIAVIPLAGGDVAEGGKLFRTYCSTCHGTTVRGGVLAFDGRNAPALADKSAAIIASTIRWGPGTMPSFPEPILNDQQLDSVVRYVKFVQQPEDPGGDPMRYYGPVSEGYAAGVALVILIGITGWIEMGGKG